MVYCCPSSSTASYSAPRRTLRFSPGRIVNKKEQVGVVGIQQVELTKVPKNRGEIGVELVVGLDKEIAIGIGKDAGELADQCFKLPPRLAVNDN